MSDSTSHPLARRTFVGGGVGLMLVGCAGSAEPWEAKPVAVESGIVEIDVKDHPELLTPGGLLALRPAGARKPVLVQRLEGDQVRVLSLRCPHLGCIVRWDNEAQVLRCPCHGSRFDDRGSVLEGPAKQALTVFRSQLVGNKVRFEYE
ncbi:MAG: Rieske 2Fe-2S domain-containing protein, partial [Myxococcales bacterium]|nr:Rieske 2Fe-2S domain-containing protein [Myxococcales bacterium]